MSMGRPPSVVLPRHIIDLIRRTSRSFHLTLRALPRAVRNEVSLLYLLARTADTLADSLHGEGDVLIEALQLYRARSMEGPSSPLDFSDLIRLQDDPSEAELLTRVEEIIMLLESTPADAKDRMRRCLSTIISGQILDLERFRNPRRPGLVALGSMEEADDYTYRVAGSVGEFWTEVSLAHLFRLEEAGEQDLLREGVRFGKGLQWVNILRDIPADLALGRCYLPRDQLRDHGLEPADLLDPTAMTRFRPLYEQYLDVAQSHLNAASRYLHMVPVGQRRMRFAIALPIVLGRRTIDLLRSGNVLDADHRIKVSRPEVKRILRTSLFATRSKRAMAAWVPMDGT